MEQSGSEPAGGVAIYRSSAVTFRKGGGAMLPPKKSNPLAPSLAPLERGEGVVSIWCVCSDAHEPQVLEFLAWTWGFGL